MSTKHFSLIVCLALSLLLMAPGCAGQNSQETQLKDATLQITQAIQSELDKLDADLSATATQLSHTGLTGPEAGQILNGLHSQYPFTIDFATADTDNKIITIVPEGYSGFQGGDISIYEGENISTEKVTKPVLKHAVVMFEFIYTDAIIWPVLSQGGDQIGSVSALFEPQRLFTGAGAPVPIGAGVELNIMQLDGLNIYDSQGDETGKNLFTDPSFQPYPDLIALGHKIVAKKSGSGTYTYIDHTTGKTVKKQAYWATAGLHGTEWRIVAVQQVAE
jgi:hypothetical protein